MTPSTTTPQTAASTGSPSSTRQPPAAPHASTGSACARFTLADIKAATGVQLRYQHPFTVAGVNECISSNNRTRTDTGLPLVTVTVSRVPADADTDIRTGETSPAIKYDASIGDGGGIYYTGDPGSIDMA
jgi:hypothetical protein